MIIEADRYHYTQPITADVSIGVINPPLFPQDITESDVRKPLRVVNAITGEEENWKSILRSANNAKATETPFVQRYPETPYTFKMTDDKTRITFTLKDRKINDYRQVCTDLVNLYPQYPSDQFEEACQKLFSMYNTGDPSIYEFTSHGKVGTNSVELPYKFSLNPDEINIPAGDNGEFPLNTQDVINSLVLNSVEYKPEDRKELPLYLYITGIGLTGIGIFLHTLKKTHRILVGSAMDAADEVSSRVDYARQGINEKTSRLRRNR